MTVHQVDYDIVEQIYGEYYVDISDKYITHVRKLIILRKYMAQ